MTVEVDFPRPSDSPISRPFWDHARAGDLAYLKCSDCGHAFLPAREDCPACLSAAVDWTKASGRARLVSWVVYHRAFHPAFADRLPYVCAIVELEEGARLISNVVGSGRDLQIDAPLKLRIEHEGDLAIPRFELADA